MNKHQINKLAMYRATRALLAAAPETGAVPAFPAVFAAFGEKIAAIESLIVAQAEPVGATIAHREAIVGEMIDATLAAAGVGSACANQRKLGDLALKMRVQASDFARLRIDQRVQLAQTVVDTLRPLLPQLAEYGLTAASLDALEAKIAAADEVSPAARQVIAQKRAATAQLAKTYREVDQLLANEMDALLRPLQRTQEKFHENYLAVREVVDRPGGRPAADVESAPPEQKAA